MVLTGLLQDKIIHPYNKKLLTIISAKPNILYFYHQGIIFISHEDWIGNVTLLISDSHPFEIFIL